MDPSFDDLLESLDAIQAERSHKRDSSSSSSSSDDEHKHHEHEHHEHHDHDHHHDDHDHHHEHHDHHHDEPHHEEHHEHEEFHLPPPQSARASVQIDFSLPPPPPPASVYEPPHQAERDVAPIESFSAPVHRSNHATPSRQGDVKQYQRQSQIIAPSRVHQVPDNHCAKCGNSLYGTEFVTAGGKNYHPEHFACVKCGIKLLGAYYDHHSQIYCPSCAGELMPCSKCHRGITGQYMILDGRPFHNECIERKHCAQCHGPIEDTVLTALGKTWHTRCFRCIQCNKELGREFIAKDGHAQCVSCTERARPACEKCRNSLSGEYITFQGQSFHQDCFVCAQCRTRLGTSGFFNVHGQLKCQRCAK